MKVILLTFLSIFFAGNNSHANHVGFTPLDIDNHPCKAENLKLTNRYICNSAGDVFCQMGWKEPEELKLRDPLHPCPLPICDVDGETCQNGECKSPDFCACEVGWEGALCDICIPMPGCQHGNCTGALECNCADGWSGGYCEIPHCSQCDNGACVGPDQCVCYSGWKGAGCDMCEPLPGCNLENGGCTDHPNTCECHDPDMWGGHLCDEPVCNDGVGCEHGTCNSHSGGNYCICETGWSGAACDQCVPYWDCPEKGLLSCTPPNECICTTPGISDPKGLCGMEALKRVTEAP